MENSDLNPKRDLAEDTFVAKWPNWLRWALFIPSAFVAAVIASTLYLILISISGFMMGFSSDGLWWQMVSSAIMGAAFVYAGTLVAPEKQFGVSVFLMILLTVVATLLFMASFSPYSSVGPMLYGVHTIIILIAGGSVVAHLKNER